MNLIFKNLETLQHMHEGPLGPYLDSYAAEMHQQGYASPTAESQIRLVADFSRWLAKRQIIPQEITTELCQRYLRFRARHRCPGRSDLAALKRLLNLLLRQGVIPESPLPTVTPADQLRDEFGLYLRQERALTAITVRGYLSFVGQFLAERFGSSPTDLSTLCAADVTGFVRRRATSMKSRRVQLVTTALRSFLRFGRYRGDLHTDLAACVRGKGGRYSQLPLPVDVGMGIANYLRSARPKAISRCVFLRSKAPVASFKGPQAIASVVRHALLRAGIHSPRNGAHQFRPTIRRCGLESGRSHHSGHEVWQVSLSAHSSIDPESALRLRVASGSISRRTAGVFFLRIQTRNAPDQTTWFGRRDHVVLLVAVQTGLRLSELTGLRRTDVILGIGAHVRCMGKGRKERCTPLTKMTVAVLKAWLREPPRRNTEMLFPSASGGPLSADSLEDLLDKHAAVASRTCPSLCKKRVTPHVLRHTAAMELLQADVDRAVIALWLGHESVETTQIYLDANLTLKEEILAKIKTPNGKPGRYKAGDELLAFLQHL